MSAPLKARIREKLQRLSLRNLDEPHVGEAAVLVALFELDEQLYFLLTKRTLQVSTHKGDVSFPGGVRHREDSSMLGTALRETEEELGIPAQQIEVLGQFHQYMAITQYVVTPYVGFLSQGFTVTPNPREVESVLSVPASFFRDTEAVVEYRKRLGKRTPIYVYDFKGNTIWGLTAKIIRDFIEVLNEN